MFRVLLGIGLIVLSVLVNSFLLDGADAIWIGGILVGIFLIITGFYGRRRQSELNHDLVELSEGVDDIIKRLSDGTTFDELACEYQKERGIDRNHCVIFLAYITRLLSWSHDTSEKDVAAKIIASQKGEEEIKAEAIIDDFGAEERVYFIAEKCWVTVREFKKDTKKDGVVILSGHFLFFFAYPFWRIGQGIAACIDEYVPFGGALIRGHWLAKEVADFKNYLRPQQIARLKALYENRYSFALPLTKIAYIGPQFSAKVLGSSNPRIRIVEMDNKREIRNGGSGVNGGSGRRK